MKEKIYTYCKITMCFVLISILISGYLYIFPKGSLGYEFWNNKNPDLKNVQKLEL
jgi:hypothetical protein